MRGVGGQSGWRWLFLIEVRRPLLDQTIHRLTMKLLGSAHTCYRCFLILADAGWTLRDFQLVQGKEGLVH